MSGQSLIQFIYIYNSSFRHNMHLIGLAQQPSKKIKDYVYNLSDLIGSGNFAKVYKGTNIKTQQIVAIKVVSLDALKSKRLEELVFEEISILQKMNHPNILKFYEALQSQRNCYIITQLCNEGNLQERIKQNRPFSQQQLSKIILDVYQGLKYLREMNVCHRDLKAANIFMNNGHAKIADFGLAKTYKEKFKDLDIGSPLYMSPQGLTYNVYGQKTDIWAFGIVIYELIHGQSPFTHCVSEMDLKTAVWKPIPEYKFKHNINLQIRKLINTLLQVDENKRPNIFELANVPYIRSLMNGMSQQKKTTKKLTIIENQKHLLMQNNSNKIIELGGSKQLFPINTRSFLKMGSNNNFEYLHMPHSGRQERNNNLVTSGQSALRMNSQNGVLHRLGKRDFSQKTIQTKQSEQENLFLRRQNRFRSINRPL